MVVEMDCRDLLTEVSIFLNVTLGKEQLSEHAQGCRLQLISKLNARQASPQPYLDMNGRSSSKPILQQQVSEFYEEFENYIDPQPQNKFIVTTGKNQLSSPQKENVYVNGDCEPEGYENLNDLSAVDDGVYINPSSPLANTPVPICKVSVVSTSSNPNSERNSVISLKKDSNSDSSSLTSGSTRGEDSAEVFSQSASALRYAASKCGVLGRREKFLFVEHTRQYWAAVVTQILHVFATDKDAKPLLQLDLTGYRARPVAITSNKTDFKFELVSPGKKTHQFVTDKKLDMDVWISALNAASGTAEMGSKDWGRQLPSPPQEGQLTDETDAASVPGYDVPRGHSKTPSFSQELQAHISDFRLSNQFGLACGNEARKLPQLPPQMEETYDQPDPTTRPVAAQNELYESLPEELYHCIDESFLQQTQKPVEAIRQLPLLPHEQEPSEKDKSAAEHEQTIQEEFYSVIDDNTVNNNQDAVYKNLGENFSTPNWMYKNLENSSRCEKEEDNYYNAVVHPEADKDQECIYDVICEQRLFKDLAEAKLADNNIQMGAVKEESKLKQAPKKSPFVANMGTILNKTLHKPNLRVVKPPILNKSCQ